MAALSSFGRYMAEEEYTDLAAFAIRHRHEQAAWLVKHQAKDMNDTTLLEAIKRLKAWSETQEVSNGSEAH